MKVQLPKEMVGDKSTMYDAFLRCAAEHGDDKDYATELFSLLPQALKETPAWFDKLTNLWRYEYGIPYDRMPEEIIISGTNVHLPVSELYTSVRIANKRLRRDQLLKFLERLSNKEKHCDVLFEMRPIKDVKVNLQTNYEVTGLGIGNTTYDWQVKGKFINIVFDVKNRTKSLLEHMKQIIPDLNRGTANILPSAPNPEDLFKSVENKLKEKCYLGQLQGVWIHSDIKEHEDKLTLYFKKTLNNRKVHFVILSDWKDDAFFLARNILIRSILKKTFGLTESKRFVTREYA
ncbi:MAG: hypothetical protein MUO85_01315 [candidate division Zixibacteria bacterium]|nr:hypothetical protein [candidate division Zixibacteria bacterium]